MLSQSEPDILANDLIPEDFRFEEDGHKYFLGDIELPGFTFLVRKFGLVPEEAFYSEYGKNRGRAVHQAIHFMNEGVLDNSSVDVRLAGYLNAWKKFCRDFDFKPLIFERPLMSANYMFACTLDAFGSGKDGLTLVEIKTGDPHWTVRLQMAAQWRCLIDSFPGLLGHGIGRIPLKLNQSGTYSIPKKSETWNVFIDEADFLALVKTHWLQVSSKK